MFFFSIYSLRKKISDVKRSIETSQNYGRTIVEEKSQSPNLPRDGVKTDPAQCSPPSFAGPKYSEDDSNDQGSVHVCSCIYSFLVHLLMKPSRGSSSATNLFDCGPNLESKTDGRVDNWICVLSERHDE